MKIKRLEISGFKSFVDPTKLTFDQDVTCVVGPNGCGKSNIVDAIGWVMGEQSAKHLRGKAMEDVIFNGSESRGRHSFAEVALTFDNSDALGPPEYRDYPEITVSRRLDREGNSQYFINKTQVRLMDVTNLFLGTGVGRRAYSIIEQGRIGLIVSAKPEDRRQLIEEAAGVTKFKARKRAAERKMEHTQQNLLRVGDIIAEIERTLASLKRQAQKAERYKRYRAEIRDLELWIAAHRWLELTAQHRVAKGQVERASATADGQRMALRVREAEVEAERAALQSCEIDVDGAQTKAYELDNTVKLLESQVEHSREQLETLAERERTAIDELNTLAAQRAELEREAAEIRERLEERQEIEQREEAVLRRESDELERRRQAAAEAEQALNAARERASEADTRIARAEAVLSSYQKTRTEGHERAERLAAESRTLEGRLAELAQQRQEIEARSAGLAGSKDEISGRGEQLAAELDELRQRLVESDEQLEQLRAELAARRSRLHSLEEIQQRFEDVGAGVRAVMQHTQGQPDSGVLGLVADRCDCPAEWTRALVAGLGHKLQYVVVEDLDAGLEALRYLTEGQRGRATLVPKAPRGEGGARHPLPGGDRVRGPLIDLVGASEGDRPLLEHLLGDVVVVDDLETARAIHARGEPHGLLVTPAGQSLHGDGTLAGGDGEDSGEHMLQIKREIRELRAEVERLDARMSQAVEQHTELRSGIASRTAALEAIRNDAHETEIALVSAEKDKKRNEEAHGEIEARIAQLAQEQQSLSQSLEELSEQQRQGLEEREAAEAAKVSAVQYVASAEQVYLSRRNAVEEQTTVVTEVRIRAAQAQEQAESDRAALDRLQRSMQELAQRATRLREDISQCAEQQGQLTGRIIRDRELLGLRVDEARHAHEELERLRARYDEARDALSHNELALRAMREEIERTSAELNQLKLDEQELALALQHLLEGVHDRHRVDVRDELTEYHAREMPDEGVRTRVEELQRLIERMGEINLTAIEEYEERSQRYEHLTAQRDDLQEALSQLDKAIRQMNRESRKLFRETFDAVNERFRRMFPRLFGGGRAELRLTNPDDLLESGVEIVAQPPGKKLGSIELMSGGEKALTAVSLVFAIFQYKPSPFCLLDEVDAPLDEANVGRFCDMIRTLTDESQFILITHSKRTMEMADVLYGVTMETPGISKLVSVEMREAVKHAAEPPQDGAAVA